MYTLTSGTDVTIATEMDRTGSVPCLTVREAGIAAHAPLLASMPRHHVNAAILVALGFTDADAAQIVSAAS